MLLLLFCIADIYGPVMGESEDVLKRFQALQVGLQQELRYHTTLEEIRGMLDTILAASHTVTKDTINIISEGTEIRSDDRIHSNGLEVGAT